MSFAASMNAQCVKYVTAYLIFVTDATDGVRVNFFWPV